MSASQAYEKNGFCICGPASKASPSGGVGRVKVGEEEDQALRPDLAGAPCFQLGPRATDHTPRGTSHFPTGLRSG